MYGVLYTDYSVHLCTLITLSLAVRNVLQGLLIGRGTELLVSLTHVAQVSVSLRLLFVCLLALLIDKEFDGLLIMTRT